ncbi:MinD/ParA family ATP-binding protein [Nocardia australiensis]|uniref:MinD/ParA family ATP-binding protein n=1 Tax=Nocardia australiensis TaxID=2887191 RepID=UPI001D14B539|nr:MinD/ParA family protein [Nocardia australiensis]
MSRAPSTNGHSTESARARGGYDAFFAPTGEPGEASVAPTPTPVAPEIGARADLSPNRTAGDPVIGAPPPQPQETAAQASADRSVPQGAATAPSGATPQTGTATPPSNTGAPQPGASGPQPQPIPHAASQHTPHAASQPTTSAHPTSQAWGDGAVASQPPQSGTYSEAAPLGTTSPGWASHGSPPVAGSPTAERQYAVPATQWVPDRVDHSAYEQTPRIEVLPATLTSIDLLADIAAARRAQLRSNSGMRGALNKVGFNLGLSPAEQRAEDRRSRIRRQLTSTYQIAVVSVKGGVGRTTTAATLGSTFASLRPDRVVAIDANPDFGDLATRTNRHPYGLTLRDLAQATNLDAFSAVQSFTSINTADLAVIASPWTTEANEALSGREYATAVEVLRRHYNLLLVDCGTGVLDSATATVLQTSDAVVVVTPATVGGVTGAVATLNWFASHGLHHLIAKSIVSIVHHQPAKPTVDVEAIEKLFATAQRPTCVVPYDEHLAEGGEIDLRLLDKDTGVAFEELAAHLSDSFPGYATGDTGNNGGMR